MGDERCPEEVPGSERWDRLDRAEETHATGRMAVSLEPVLVGEEDKADEGGAMVPAESIINARMCGWSRVRRISIALLSLSLSGAHSHVIRRCSVPTSCVCDMRRG